MAVGKHSFVMKSSENQQRLDQVLAERLPQVLGQPISKAKVRKLIIAGAVYLNQRRVRIASKEVFPGAKVDVYVDLKKLNSTERDQDISFVMTPDRILFEDEDLIAVNKPPGLPTQPTVDEARNNLFLSVKNFLAQRTQGVQRVQDSERTGAVSQVYLGLHHRLDRDTSGIILFTKSQRANSGVAELFSKHLAVKTYHALAFVKSQRTGQPIAPCFSVKNYLGRIPSPGKKAKYGAVRSGGDFAHTDFTLIRRFRDVIQVEALLHTGRTHQIRVHLSERGMPILGDPFYGGPETVKVGKELVRIPRMMLHAAHLTFPHPIHQNKISIECGLPGDFTQCLRAIQEGEVQGKTAAPTGGRES